MEKLRTCAFVNVFMALLIPTFLRAAVAVEGLTQDKLGMTEEEFVPLELAKKVALYLFLTSFPEADTLKVKYVIFPWVIEGLDEFEPSLKTAYYQIGVYESDSSLPFEAYVNEVRYRAKEIDDLTASNNSWDSLIIRTDISKKRLSEILGTGAISSCLVSINRNTPWSSRLLISGRFGLFIYYYGLVDKIAEKATGISGWEYENSYLISSRCFVQMKRGEERIFIGLGVFDNRPPYIFRGDGFDRYLESNFGYKVRRYPGEKNVPVDFGELESGAMYPPNKLNYRDDLDSDVIDKGLKGYTPDMVQNTSKEFWCGDCAVADNEAFWGYGGRWEDPIPTDLGCEFDFLTYDWPYGSTAMQQNFLEALAYQNWLHNGISPCRYYLRLIKTTFKKIISNDVKHWYSFPDLAVDKVCYPPGYDYRTPEHWPAYPRPNPYWDPCSTYNWIKLICIINNPKISQWGGRIYNMKGLPFYINFMGGKDGQGWKWKPAHAACIWGYDNTNESKPILIGWGNNYLGQEWYLYLKEPHKIEMYEGADACAIECLWYDIKGADISPLVEAPTVTRFSSRTRFDWIINHPNLVKGIDIFCNINNNYVKANQTPILIKSRRTKYSFETDYIQARRVPWMVRVTLINGREYWAYFEEVN